VNEGEGVMVVIVWSRQRDPDFQTQVFPLPSAAYMTLDKLLSLSLFLLTFLVCKMEIIIFVSYGDEEK